MRISDSCAKCLFDRQVVKMQRNPALPHPEKYISGVKEILDNRKEEDCSPYMVHLFGKLYHELYGEASSYAELKKEYNDMVLSMEEELEKKIEGDGSNLRESLIRALTFARIGNYIDFGAMDDVDQDTFMGLFEKASFSEKDQETFDAFCKECEKATRFLLIADNCGEIVVDKLFIRTLKKCFPQLKVQVLVRGGEVLNDATMEDAIYSGIDQEAELISNGTAVAGTIYEMVTEQAKEAIDHCDVLLLKGQGNFESFYGNWRHAYYAFLCKCNLFTEKFQVPLFTGMFVSE